MTNFIGIDVSAKTLVIAFRQNGGILKVMEVDQTPTAHAQVVQLLQNFNPKRIVLEATGIYYFDIAVRLYEAGLPVSVINPRSYHHFAKLKLNSTKTDAKDAELLAEYAERMSPELWVAPEHSRLMLRNIGRQINRLTSTRTQAKNRLHALKARQDTFSLLLEDEQEGIDMLDQRLKKLTVAALKLIHQNTHLSQAYAHLCSAKGVGQTTAIALLAELSILPESMKAPQISCYAGLDVKHFQSGSSVNKASRISKAGNTYLRASLFMMALSTIRYEPRTMAFYKALQARGKKKMQALCAVMRKYLTGLWACMCKGEDFDPAKLFSDIHFNKA